MRYAVFSDVHANLPALETVLDDCRRERIDRYLCLGDLVGYAADPRACISRVRGVADVVLAGNHDRAACGPADTAGFNVQAAEALRWTHKALSPADLAYLAGLPLTFVDRRFSLAHGSLHEPEQFHYLTDAYLAWPTFAGMRTQLGFVGHTHVAGTFVQYPDHQICWSNDAQFVLEADRRYLVNVGSVGQPRDSDPRAAYCILDTRRGRVELRRREYDVAAARARIIAAGLPRFLGDRLLSGS